VPVRESIKKSRSPDGGKISGVETEEKDSRLALIRDVGAHVEFWHRGKHGNRRDSGRPDIAHPKRQYGEPRHALIKLKGERRWHEGAKDGRVNGVVEERKIVPGLRHHPWSLRWEPRTMIDFVEETFGANEFGFDVGVHVHTVTQKEVGGSEVLRGTI